jgi:hypothetical protein
MKTLVIQNNTLIEPDAFQLLGACTKRGTNSIGYFGSGLKYAIAVLLRDNIPFQVFSGLQEIYIDARPTIFRGKEFNVIYINGQKTSLTTDMGPDWKLWHAIREIFCNAIDEGEYEHSLQDDPQPKENTTVFHIKCVGEQLEAIATDWTSYFAMKRIPLAGNEVGKIYNRAGQHMTLYRKGVRAYDEQYTSLFDYDFHNIHVNECRIISWSCDIQERICKMWASMATKQMLSLYCTTLKEERFEHRLRWHDSCPGMFNDDWFEFFKDKLLIPLEYAGWYPDDVTASNAIQLPTSLLSVLISEFPDLKSVVQSVDVRHEYLVSTPTKREIFKLNKVLEFFKEVGIEIKYEILIARFTDSKIYGRAHNGKIILSTRLFDLGLRRLAETILEEIAHLESCAGDNTREMQNYLIGQILTLLENQHGIFL